MVVALPDPGNIRWEIILLSLIPGLINFCIFLYSFFRLDHTRLTTSYSLFALFLGLWQISDGFMKISSDIFIASSWNKIANLTVLIAIPLGILFILSLSRRYHSKHLRIVSLLIFSPVFLFTPVILEGLDKYTLVRAANSYWIAKPDQSTYTLLLYGWIGLGCIIMLVILWSYYLQNRNNLLKREQALLLAAGLSIPAMAGIFFEVFLPIFFPVTFYFPVTGALITVFSIVSFIAIKKYKILNYSPLNHWGHIIESINDSLLIVDNHDRIQYANRTCCETLGYTLAEMEGRIAYEFLVDKSQVERIKNAIRERLEKKNGRYETVLIAKNGECIDILMNGSPYLDHRGRVAGSIGIMSNITHLKETEKNLAHNEARLKQAQEVAGVGSWEVNFAANKAIWSDEACRIYGISDEERNQMSFETWISCVHPEDLQLVQQHIDKARSDYSNLDFRHRILRKDGTERHLHSVARYEFDMEARPIGMFGICHDITEQVKAQKALEESENRSRTFISESLLPIFFADPLTKKILYYNRAFSDLIGYDSAELEQMLIYDFIDHPREEIDERIVQTMQKTRIRNEERQWRKKDGTIVRMLVSTVYQPSDRDTIYVTAQDITENKFAEEKLKEINKELEIFIYKASHDIRGPLASILGLVNVGKMEIAEGPALDYLNMIGTASKKLDYTLTELVKAMRIKDVSIFTDVIDFRKLIAEVLGKYRHYPGIEKIDISFTVDVEQRFLSNIQVVETILQNLIENAIKYQNNRDNEPFLKICVSEAPGKVFLVVKDNGIGIEDSLQAQVFDMYFRGTASSQGSGLGLYLVWKAVEKLRGEIRLKSKVGEGTVFTITLPTM